MANTTTDLAVLPEHTSTIWRILEPEIDPVTGKETGKLVVVEYELTLTKRGVRIVFANQKGGVGKTTDSVNVAAEMAAADVPTLMVDLDPQANASKALGIDSAEAELTIYEVLHPDPDKRVTIDEAMIEVAPNLFVVCGHKAMSAIAENGAGPGTEMLLARALKAVKQRFRAIFIDCPPNLGRLFMMALAGSDDDEIKVVIPVKCGPFELDGLGLMLDTIDKIRKNGLAVNLEIVATIATMFDGRRNIDRDVDAYLAKNFADEHVRRPIRTSVRLVESSDEGQPLREYSPREPVNGDLANLAYVVAQRSLV